MRMVMIQTSRFRDAVFRVLRPIVRLLIHRNVGFPEFSDWAKALYVSVAAEEFGLEQKRVTDSRISVLTMLQRKDVRVLRSRQETEQKSVDQGGGLLPQILALWGSGDSYVDARGQPIPLPRMAGDGSVSFEALVAEVSRDVHARTILDELIRVGAVEDVDGLLILSTTAFLPNEDEEATLGYWGANLGDHVEAATQNVLSAPKPGPFFERAVHYNRLSETSMMELDTLARSLQQEVLAKLNARALALQTGDETDPQALGRFRCGAFVFRSSDGPIGRDV